MATSASGFFPAAAIGRWWWPVVKVKGEWVDAEVGGAGGVRMLTK